MAPIKYLFYMSFSAMFFSCHNSKLENKYKTIVIESLISLDVPNDYSLISRKGTDSYVFEITNNKGFVLHGDLGMYKNIIIDPPIIVFDLKNRDNVLKRMGTSLDSTITFFSENPLEDQRQNIFSKQFYLYDTINGIITKIIQPKKIGKGVTAIYVPNLKDNQRFTLYSTNLDSNQHKLAMEIFKTIRYPE